MDILQFKILKIDDKDVFLKRICHPERSEGSSALCNWISRHKMSRNDVLTLGLA